MKLHFSTNIKQLSFVVLVCAMLALHPATAMEKKSGVVSVAFVGDVMLDGLPGKIVRDGKDPFAALTNILSTSGIRIANLECVIATTGRRIDKPYNFRAHPRTIKLLKRHFDAVSLANNHTGDFGVEAFKQMLRLLDEQGLSYFGGGHNLRHAHTPLFIDRNGIRIAFLGYNEFLPRSFEADFDRPGQAWSEDEQVVLDIRNARSMHRADLVIPYMHWGFENEPVANLRQRRLARLMIDAGADAIVGSHPHVIQDVEYYRGKPVFYSLGNFVFDGFIDKKNKTGWLLELELDVQGVRHWHTREVRIDRNGLPHPVLNIKH
jgi:hypothetical protein